jgi:5-methyltetrahydrofolate--homocysteine methyltransferase
MTKSEEFLSKLNQGALMTADGATGTNLLQRGMPVGQPSDLWVLDNPDEVVRLHRDFIAAGSDIILTNTFGAKSVQLSRFNLADRVHQINLKAVDLARQAVGDQPVYIAGSIGPLGTLLKPYGTLEEKEAEAAILEQAQALIEGGVDLMVIETQYDLREAILAVQAVRSLSDLPLVCSFSYDRGLRTMMGVNPSQMAEEIGILGVNLLGINCGHSLEENLANLKELAENTDLPVWFKPNAGLPSMNEANHPVYSVSPEEMGNQVPLWLEAGARIVGGCCGTSPTHLEQIHAAVVKHQS